ncbi:GNAT family N-acetyltransferase [Alkalicoccobacillus murimartini]|uniref:Ribosomal protein S18 acetylase RimI-like enzyme n=1 Tax=Alkalicoccobacillus murimartini TaxID=171685 RepID=A0ABT9YML7_9BACI|nr:GNAT family N-acetyltransferase [Alkalicoccobacillus murimartini]MDQ0208244.1 ribosomal protein S18 acetylase RimI-like enzyme [Alkalicoccobacillus murimartini]
MIRFATENENEEDIRQINELTYSILETLDLKTIRETPKESYLDFLAHLFANEGNRFSYHNFLISELEGRIAAIAIVYHHDDAHYYDKKLSQEMGEYFSVSPPSIQPETKNDEYYIDSIAVAEDFRNQRIGSMLLEAIEEEAYDKGYTYLSLNVDESNEHAMRLYKRFDFTVHETFELYGHPYYHMIKNLIG